MPKKPTLPIAIHDHFRKANVLHGYVQKNLGEATKHAIETGQELHAAKKAIPHGRWEDECERLFDGSLRTAQFYMQFARDVAVLPKAQTSAILLLEGTLDGAAKAARQAATGAGGKKPPKRHPPLPSAAADEYSERHGTGADPFDVDPSEEAPESPETPAVDSGPRSPQKRQPPKKLDRNAYYKQWDDTIGPLVRLVDKIAEGVGEKHDPHHEAIHDALNTATEEMMAWMGV
jgi:hypothetical protein